MPLSSLGEFPENVLQSLVLRHEERVIEDVFVPSPDSVSSSKEFLGIPFVLRELTEDLHELSVEKNRSEFSLHFLKDLLEKDLQHFPLHEPDADELFFAEEVLEVVFLNGKPAILI